MIEILPATRTHVEDLAPRVRRSDHVEALVATGVDAAQGLRDSWAMSTDSWAVLQDGRCVCIWGVAPWPISAPTYGIPWLLASPEFDAGAGLALMRHRDRLFPRMFDRCGLLQNLVMASNAKAIRMLAWLGFRFGPKTRMGGGEFVPFHMRRSDLKCA